MTSETPVMDIEATTAAEYRQAILAVRDCRKTKPAIWDLWVALLKTQYKMPGHTVTPAQLAAAHKLNSPGAASLNYGKLGHVVADRLGYLPPAAEHAKRDPMWWMTLSKANGGDPRDGECQFTMHPQLAEALEFMHWVQPAPSAD